MYWARAFRYNKASRQALLSRFLDAIPSMDCSYRLGVFVNMIASMLKGFNNCCLSHELFIMCVGLWMFGT
jgi:hypothetical protein